MERSEAEDFLYAEARMLDAGQLREWQKLFTEDATYWIPANRTDCDPDQHVSFVYDNMDLLNERLGRLESDQCYAQIPPSTTLHQIGNVQVENNGGNQVRLHSNLVLHEFRNNTQRRFYPLQTFPAQCEHVLEKQGKEWKIKFKKVSLLNCDGEIPDLTFLI